MEWNEANEIFNEVLGATSTDRELFLLQNEMRRAAMKYARIRADWSCATVEVRSEMSAERTAAHNAFIDTCNALSRLMLRKGLSSEWRVKLGENRVEIGDFACYVHCLLGLRAR